MPPRIAAIICAAGLSNRMGGVKKEYQLLGPDCLDKEGRPLTVLGSSVSAFAACGLSPILIATAGDDAGEAAACVPIGLLEQGNIFFTPGGITRRQSVHHALLYLESFNVDFVLIHDGARPWVSAALIKNVIEATLIHKAVIPVIPALDTPKLINNGFVSKHLKRAEVGLAQTPQGFAFDGILEAHKRAKLREETEAVEYTDDAEVWAESFGAVAVIPGEKANKKITFPGDLAL